MNSNGISRGHNGDSRRSSMVDATGRFCSQPMRGSPEILVGLCYDDKHEVVSVSIEKASSLGADVAPPDSFIRIIALDEFNGELMRHKTDTVKHNTQPVYSHHCTLKFSKDKVETSTVRVEVWTVTGMLKRKHQVGSISIGFASSTPDANEHWQQMMQGAGITVAKWHAIQSPDA
uniref:C2 domain-containing protein n=1 Tax=Caenorhabditis japonica TaxID=281687 RepID=A0A8R1DVY5_CAEJA